MEVAASIQSAVNYQAGQIQAYGGAGQGHRWGAHRGGGTQRNGGNHGNWGGHGNRGIHGGRGGHGNGGCYSGSVQQNQAPQNQGNWPVQSAENAVDQAQYSQTSQAVSMFQNMTLEQTESSMYLGINLVYRERSMATQAMGETGGVQTTIQNLMVNVNAEFQLFMSDGTGEEAAEESGGWDTAFQETLAGLQEFFGSNVLAAREQADMSDNGMAAVLDKLDQAFDQLVSGLRSAFGISDETEGLAGETDIPALDAVPTGDVETEETGTNDVLVSGLGGNQENVANETTAEAADDQASAAGAVSAEETDAADGEDTDGTVAAASDEGSDEATGTEDDKTAAGSGFITRLQSIYTKSRMELVTSLGQGQDDATDEKQGGTTLRLQSSMTYGYQYYQNPFMSSTSLYYRQNLNLRLVV